MAVDLLPDGPDPANDTPQAFSQKAAAFVLAQKTMVAQFNEALGHFNASLAGGAYAMGYVFDTATADADPGPGKLRLSSTTQNAATVLRLDVVAGATDVSSILDMFDASTSAVKGSVRLVKVGDPTKWLTFDITARAAPSGYRNFTVVNTGGSSANPFATGDGVLLFFQRNGDKGDIGSAVSFPSFRVQDMKSTGTPGGTPISTVSTRVLNTVTRATLSGASLSNNQVTLPAGTYKVTGSSPGYMVNGHQAYLYNLTTPAALIWGTSEFASSTDNIQSRSLVAGEITLSTTSVLELRHYMSNLASNGLGTTGGSVQGGSVGIFAEILFEKVG